MSKRTKVFLVIFTVFLIAITAIAIYYKNVNVVNEESHIIIENGQKISNNSIADEDSSFVKGMSIEDTYSTNGLQFEYEVVDINNVGVDLVKFSGLKNVEIQENINSEIRERIKKILDSNTFRKNSNESAHVTTYVEANFSDVLSVKIVVKFNENFIKEYGLNYRLDSGERLKIDDLFVKNAPKKNIISEAAYKTFALNYYTAEGIANDFYTNIEGKVVSYLLDYNDGKITEFSFNTHTIELYRDGRRVVIDMIDYVDYIAVYKKYVSSYSLYEYDDGIVKNIPVFVSRFNGLYDLYDRYNELCYVDVVIYSDDILSSSEKKVVEAYKKDLVSRLAVLRNEKGVYYSNYIKVTRGIDHDENILIFTEKECFAECNENEFNTKIYDVILSAERDKNNRNDNKSKIYYLDKSLLKSSEGIVKYSLKTKKELVEVVEDERQEELEEDDSENESVQNQIQNAIENSSASNNQNSTNEVENAVSNESLPAANVTTQVIY